MAQSSRKPIAPEYRISVEMPEKIARDIHEILFNHHSAAIAAVEQQKQEMRKKESAAAVLRLKHLEYKLEVAYNALDAIQVSNWKKVVFPMMTESPTTDKAKEIFHALSDKLGELKERWADEHEYEDFEDYRKEARRQVEKLKVIFISLSEYPFRLIFQLGNDAWAITVTGRNISLSQWKGPR